MFAVFNGSLSRIMGLSSVFVLSGLLLAGCWGKEEEAAKKTKETVVAEGEVKEPAAEAPEAVSDQPKLIKLSITPFANPESVLFDEGRNQFYVSEANFAVNEGGGKISLLDGNGKLVKPEWVTGLNHPKGLGMTGDKLYVSDVTEVVEIDIPSGKITERYKVEGAKFLNDVTVSPDGDVYISDTITNQITKIGPDGTVEAWLKDDKLDNPNGVLVHDGALYVAAWGTVDGDTVEALTKAKPIGRLMKVSLEDKSITVLSQEPVGNLDGLEANKDGNFWVSDWISGRLYLMSPEGAVLQNLDMAKHFGIDSAQGFADIEYKATTGEIWVPMMLKGSVLVLSEEVVKTLK